MNSSNSELQIKLVYLELLSRLPISDEINEYEQNLINGSITISDLRTTIIQSNEYSILKGTYDGDLIYDPSIVSNTVYDVSLSNYPTSEAYAGNYDGVMLANGKIGFVTSSKPNEVESSFITTSFDFDQLGQYSKNTIDAFNYGGFDLFELNLSNSSVENDNIKHVSYENVVQKLNMYQATFTNEFDCSVDGSSNLHVTTKIAALRQYPYCAIQKYTFSNTSDSIIDMPFYHKISSDEKQITNVRYNNNIINHSSNTHFFNATGDFVNDDNEKVIVSVNNCYIVESSDPNNISYKGYNLDRTNTNLAYNQMSLTIPVGDTITVTTLTCMMTSKDFRSPELETTRILVNLLNKTPNEILVEHNLEWAKMWDSRIVIEERTDIDSSIIDKAMTDINLVKRFTYYSLYNIYSVTRDDINVEVNPLNLSTLDSDGSLFWNSELWILPVLIFMKPKIARTLLNFRFRQLERAKKLAIAHGFKGAKFPFENDNVNYKDVYWSSISPLHIFNTALISINTWNYFRVTRDIDWLRTTGYKILKNNAEFFQSKSEYDVAKGQYVMKNTIGYNNIQGDNNMLTNYLGKLALQYGMEASYELNYIPDSRWRDALNMSLPITSTPTTQDIPNATPSGTDIFVDVESVNSVDTYVFYNGTSPTDAITTNLLGYTFGQNSGINIVLTANTIYTFHLSSNLSNKPIKFCDAAGNTIVSDSGSTALEHVEDSSKKGYHSGSFVTSSATLSSYKWYKGEYLNTYGYNVFTTDSTKVNVTNLLRVNEEYNGESIDLLEQFIVMYPYYSRHFFTLPSTDNPYNNKTIKNNMLYYNGKLTSNGETLTFNKLIESGLYATIAQDDTSYAFRKNYINTFYSRLLDTIDKNTTKPWGALRKNTSSKKVHNNVSLSALHLLTLLTTMGGLRVTGSINESRYYTEEYGIKQRSGYVMPETWKTMKITGIGGVKNAEYIVQNTNFLSSHDDHHLNHCPCP